MESVVQLSAYRRPRPAPQPAGQRQTVEAAIVILPVVRIVRGEDAAASQGVVQA